MKKIYFYLSLILSVAVNAQNIIPGGITNSDYNLELWLKADELDLSLPIIDGMPVAFWRDLSGNERHYNQYISPENNPYFRREGLMNFNPHLLFTGAQVLEGPQSYVLATRSYFVIYVSMHEEREGYVYTLHDGGTSGPSHGWTATKRPVLRDGGTQNFGVDVDRSYGITLFERPNITGAANPSTRITHNLVQREINRRVNIGTSTNNSYIGNRQAPNETASNLSPYIGEVQEIIVISAPQGQRMDDESIHKIHSYLSIKYGITLDNFEYTDAENNKVWSLEKNEGYNNNVFGIAHDSKIGLYQKQSGNYERSLLTLFVGDELKELNVENNGTIPEGGYVMVGFNGKKSFLNGYVPDPNLNFDSDVNYINEQKFKVQTNLTEGITLNLKPNVSGTYVLVSDDENFSATANTRIHKIIGGIAQNVKLNDGEYIGFVLHAPESPGGVIKGLRVWLRSDDQNKLSLLGNEVDVWKDQTSYANDFSYTASTRVGKLRPKFIGASEKMNFYPAINFDVAGTTLAVPNGRPMGSNNPENYYSFLIYYLDIDNNPSSANSIRLYTHTMGRTSTISGIGRPSIGFSPSEGGGRVYSAGERNGDYQGFQLHTTALQMLHIRNANAPEKAQLEFNFSGKNEIYRESLPSNFGSAHMMSSGASLGGGYIEEAQFYGHMAEMLMYEEELTQDEIEKVQTYLGVKYAITLDKEPDDPNINFDYILSNGEKVWAGNSVPFKKYHNEVAGLVYDKNSLLFNNRAKSTAASAALTIELPSMKGVPGQGSEPLLPNLSGIFWGNNGKHNMNLRDVSIPIYPNANAGIDRIWMMQKTNLPEQEIVINAETTLNAFPFNSTHQVFMIVTEEEPTENQDINEINWTQAISGEWIDNKAVFNYTAAADRVYFTFVGINTYETCSFQGVKTLNVADLWMDSSNYGNTEYDSIDLGGGFTGEIKIIEDNPGKQLVSNYPRTYKDFVQIERQGRRSDDAGKAITTEVSFSETAKVDFYIYEIDRLGRRLDDIEIIGYSNENDIGSIVYPTLSYVDTEEESSYTITGNRAYAKSGTNSTAGQDEDRGKMFVKFEIPVQKIKIIWKVDYLDTARGTKRIGISSFNIYCQQSSIKEEDLTLQKTVSNQTVKLCEEVSYVFTVSNTNNVPKIIEFEDILPQTLDSENQQMKWIGESLTIGQPINLSDGEIYQYGESDEGYPYENPIISDYEDSDTLAIQDLYIPANTSLTFRAKANFIENSAVTGVYSNQATITYEKLNEGEVTHPSCDLYKENCEPTEITAEGEWSQYVEVTNSVTTCFSLYTTHTFKVNITLTNPNSFTAENITFESFFEDGFYYIPGTLKINEEEPPSTVSVSPSMPESATEAEYEDNQGFLIADNLSLESGLTTIEFEVQIPWDSINDPNSAYHINTNNVGKDIDDPTYFEGFGVSTSFLSNAKNPCEYVQFKGTPSDQLVLPCKFCTKPPLGNIESPSVVGISTIKSIYSDKFEQINNGFIVMESNDKGFVITRLTEEEINNIPPENLIEGMLVYNKDQNCVMLYSDLGWNCIGRTCNE